MNMESEIFSKNAGVTGQVRVKDRDRDRGNQPAANQWLGTLRTDGGWLTVVSSQEK